MPEVKSWAIGCSIYMYLATAQRVCKVLDKHSLESSASGGLSHIWIIDLKTDIKQNLRQLPLKHFLVLMSASSSPISTDQPLNGNPHGADYSQDLSAGMTVPVDVLPDVNTLAELCVFERSTVGCRCSSQHPVSPLSLAESESSVPNQFHAEISQIS